MFRKAAVVTTLIVLMSLRLNARENTPVEVYFITCGPGTETYSIYGHSALRIINPAENSDIIYNWGVFDFDAPNFAWKFAKGRLEYYLGTENTGRFFAYYESVNRYVLQQRVYLNDAETEKLLLMIKENLRPENVSYKYDFFYDDCSTRIRDLFEKSVGDKLVYPTEAREKDKPTFRDLTDQYQEKYQWLKLGIDLIMGSPGEKKASVRDRMFLPVDMQKVLSETLVQREGKLVPLLSSPAVILDFPPPRYSPNALTSPGIVASALMILIIVSTLVIKKKSVVRIIDISVFSVFSVLALLMIFFNFFTDHAQMRWNYNIVWLNPVIIASLFALVINKPSTVLFRILFVLTSAFLILQFFLPQEFNIAFFPLAVIILVRSSAYAGFGWNPVSRHV